uniref:WGS project CBMI000000000 data, contig CS3069_c004995 n=1 Tax=Fusarium clavum TaxID=2594811 RepID=A0A090MF37_9HYPO|nr:unnamed protein product [Fusarium clavum]
MAVDSQIAREVALHKLRTYLRKESSNVGAKSEHDETALHLAVLTGIDEVIPELLKYGADVNVESTHKALSLHFASFGSRCVTRAARRTNQEPHGRRQSSLAFWKSTNKPWSEEIMRNSIEKAKKLFCDIKDVRDEPNILKSAARFQRVVQRNLARGKRDLDISADYVENDIREMYEVASRIQSALNTTLSLQQSEIANEQAQISANQNKVLMTFTFATLLFVSSTSIL